MTFDIKNTICIYISGGITGKPDGNKAAFNEMEKKLHSLGFDVENPRRAAWPGYLSLDDPKESKEGWCKMMRLSLKNMMECDAIVFLPDWEQSKGATIEYQVAVACGIPCFTADLKELVPDCHTPPRLLVTP